MVLESNLPHCDLVFQAREHVLLLQGRNLGTCLPASLHASFSIRKTNLTLIDRPMFKSYIGTLDNQFSMDANGDFHPFNHSNSNDLESSSWNNQFNSWLFHGPKNDYDFYFLSKKHVKQGRLFNASLLFSWCKIATGKSTAKQKKNKRTNKPHRFWKFARKCARLLSPQNPV